MAQSKWQPLLLILEDGARYNCTCGALAVITRIQRPDPAATTIQAIDYCHACWERERAQEGQSVSQEQESPPKWQPVVLILQGQRLECHCGALAVFITGKVSEDDYNCMDNVDVWCQDCFDKARKEQEGGESSGRQTK
jgi:hypothetical protein